MKAQNGTRIMIITGVLATFVLYLCAGVSKLLPLMIAVIFAVLSVALISTPFSPFSERIRITQKRE